MDRKNGYRSARLACWPFSWRPRPMTRKNRMFPIESPCLCYSRSGSGRDRCHASKRRFQLESRLDRQNYISTKSIQSCAALYCNARGVSQSSRAAGSALLVFNNLVIYIAFKANKIIQRDPTFLPSKQSNSEARFLFEFIELAFYGSTLSI